MRQRLPVSQAPGAVCVLSVLFLETFGPQSRAIRNTA
jgi:hypothetical protein